MSIYICLCVYFVLRNYSTYLFFVLHIDMVRDDSFFFLFFFLFFLFFLFFTFWLSIETFDDENDDVMSSVAFPSSENAPLLVASSIGQNTTKASNTTLRDDGNRETSSSFSSSSAMIKRGGRAIGIVAFFILGAGCVVGMSSRVSQKGVVEEGFVAKAKTTIVSSSNNNNNDDDDDAAFGTMRSSKPPPRKSSVREHQHQQQKLGMELDGYDLDANAFGGDIWHVPFEYYKDTKWASAKFWRPGSNELLEGDTSSLTDEARKHPDETKYMPVFKSKGVDSAPVVVTAHATNWKSNGWVILDSAKKNGLEIVISGNGTTFHGFADKMMGLKAALHSIPGNPIIVNADATDVLLQCGPEEFEKRFEQADADFIFGGETQLWPEIRKYFGMEDEIEFKKEMSLTFGEIGKAAGDDVELTGEHPNVWANAGSFMGRKEELMKYIEATENRMVRHNDWKEEDGFGMICKPAATTDEEVNTVFPGMRQFDDQECLTAFQMQKNIERSRRHKLDADGSILFSAGGAPMSQLGRDANGMVYNKQTGKASCLWHFNNPQAKIRLKDFANAFPERFLTDAGRRAMVNTPDGHPGNRNGEIGPSPSEAAK